MAFDENHKMLGLKVDTIANLGAYMSLFSSLIPTYLYGPLMSGQYVIPAIHVNVRAVYTNTVPVDAVRGADGRRRPTSSSGSSRPRRVNSASIAPKSAARIRPRLPLSDSGPVEVRFRQL